MSQCHQFLSGNLYIYQVDYHKRVAQISLDSVLQNLFNLTFEAPARSLTSIHYLQKVHLFLSAIIGRQIQCMSSNTSLLLSQLSLHVAA